MAIALHPYISGVPHRIKYLDTVLRRLSRKKGVLLWNGAQILEWYLKSRAGNGADYEVERSEMKLLTFSVEGKARPGALKGDRVIDLAAAGLPAGPHGGLLEIARGGDAMLERARKALDDAGAKSYALSAVKVLPPIRQPSKIIAVGLNYIDHCKEAGLPVPTEPVLFSKFTTSICGPYDDLSLAAGRDEGGGLRGGAGGRDRQGGARRRRRRTRSST